MDGVTGSKGNCGKIETDGMAWLPDDLLTVKVMQEEEENTLLYC
jgi:hypothetical protein